MINILKATPRNKTKGVKAVSWAWYLGFLNNPHPSAIPHASGTITPKIIINMQTLLIYKKRYRKSKKKKIEPVVAISTGTPKSDLHRLTSI